MLTINIPEVELFDEATSTFSYVAETKLVLEHSLFSLSKWEQFYEKPFLSDVEKTTEEVMYYIKCMTISEEEVPERVYNAFTQQMMDQVSSYINAKMTATWFNEPQGKKDSGEAITAEVIYYWLVALQIPFEVQHWHLNRLLTLVKVTNIKNDPEKKMMPKEDVIAQQRRLNQERKALLQSRG